MQRNYTKRFTCQVCGQPIAKEGATHWRCKTVDSPRYTENMQIGLSKLLKVTQDHLSQQPNKKWTREDGKDRLRELFPDMVDRI